MATQGIGRVAFVANGEPAVLPVSFAIVGEVVVFRTAFGSAFGWACFASGCASDFASGFASGFGGCVAGAGFFGLRRAFGIRPSPRVPVGTTRCGSSSFTVAERS